MEPKPRTRSRGVEPRRCNSPTREPEIFFKIILNDKKLSMPEIFVQKFGEQLSPIFTVNGPNGQVWKLGLENENDTICFSDGWEKFLDHYSISLGHILIFKYEGNSVFNVLEIFDATACKIGYHYDSLSSDVEPDSVHIEEEQKDFGFNDEISVSTSYSPSQSSSECETSNEYLSQGTLKKRKKYTTWTDRKKKQKHIRKGASNVPTATQSCEKCVHHKQSEFAEEEAAAAKTPKEHRFHSSVKGNPKSKYICALQDFALKYLPSESIKLQNSEGRQWPARCFYREGSGAGRSIRKGWATFSKENDLEEGDVIVFELINRNTLVLEASIFRMVEFLDDVN
uniref:TF-B3 domain-containing protein n=1 Tax=Fagus sylvatica TaxID=28930 RepID=A0A2N9G8A2_FAGSY